MRLFSTIAVLALLLGAPALAETSVGVTAAVNPDATGTVGSTVRTISLGDSVVFNQRIETGGTGLVQVLLADGTTFMVGPNSNLVIDSFVYDPNAGTAQVTASFTKGVLRFIGGQTSKTEGGVTINTPVGTMGIRGAMVDIVLDPPAGTPPHIDMLFGNEVTLEQGQQLLGRLYAAGYSLALGPNGTFDVLKTPPGWGSQIQAALAGKAGATGGAPKGPNDGDVKESEVANKNSGNGVNKNTGQPPLSQAEIDALLEAAAQYDELRNFILNNQTPQGYIGGLFTADFFVEAGTNDYDATFEQDSPDDLLTYVPEFAELAFDADGNPVRLKASFLIGSVLGCYDDCGLTFEGDGSSGTLFATIEESVFPIQTTNNLLINHDDPSDDNPLTPELAAELDCENCADFIRWGFWGFSAGDVPDGEGSSYLDFLGTWVAGNLTTAAQLNQLASPTTHANAYYRGDAVGVVNYSENTPYVATGHMEMEWNFGSRLGSMAITDIAEDLDILYSLESPTGSAGFLGRTEFGFGVVQGAFVNNGSDLAAGVAGSWNYNNGSYYSVSGVFMGEGYTPSISD
jgi:hypothetical protein